ncbi:MAG: phenylacetic acid degradation bifunctional protein PaaZ, partial [Calditrichaeota bacterium]|nr:phenylacetic acid degradation bifunctional protein PaaZ [Calditrichota bacterium]
VKPASQTAYLTEKMVQAIIESKLLPEGALQLICGSSGDLIDHLDFQDVLTFTGSASTGLKLKANPAIINNSVRYNMEADSLNCSILGTDVTPDKVEFDLFIKEVAREMTVKAGQKCTAIRRTIVPEHLLDDVNKALQERLSKIIVGDPKLDDVRMGPLASLSQQSEVRKRIDELKASAELVFGGNGKLDVKGDHIEKGAWIPATVLISKNPFKQRDVHDIEAFGPVTTLMPYKTTEDAIELAKLGKGSLVGSLFTANDQIAKEITMGIASHHGRLMIINEYCSKESTGHGSPLPHLVHGGPGRAGGGEELGGIRSVLHYMQRTALQGSPTTISHIINEYLPGAAHTETEKHPFKKYFDELKIGDSLTTHRRTITEADVVNFAGVSGDYFYAHTDEIAAERSLFKKRVAHGYFVVSAAAGLFVWPGEGPVLANYGLENLRFIEPVYIGDTIHLKLICKQKTEKEAREDEKLQGVVEWAVEIYNQDELMVATYSILTLVERKK